MYLITCGASWVNGDFSWVRSSSKLSKKAINDIGPFLLSDFSDPTAFRNILNFYFKCDTYNNLAYGGSSNQHQIELLKYTIKKDYHRNDVLVLFGLKPFEHEDQLSEILSIPCKNLFIFNTISTQLIDNALLNSKDLLSIMSDDFTPVIKEGDEAWQRKIFKCYKKGLVDIHRAHPTAEGHQLIATLLINEIKKQTLSR
jgi:lysophospholipase L1-like esterase